MAAGRHQETRDNLEVFCFDLAALVDLCAAGLLRKLRKLAQSGRLKVPEGVYKESQRQTDKLARTIKQWRDKYSVVVDLDNKALGLLRSIERKYGQPFSLGNIKYPGFWKSPSGRKSADGQVVALAKSRGWTVISNDNSVHGACMFENVKCYRWEEIGRLLKPEQARLPGM